MVPEHGGERANLDGLAPDAPVEVLIADIGAPEVAAVIVGADVVFNVAGQVSHLASMQDPLRDLDLNVRSQLAFLETLRHAAPTARVVQTSTRQVYGRPRYLPVDEDHPTVPVDVNGIDKLACEQLHRLYGELYDMQVTVLRLTNVYGPRQHLERQGLGFLPVFIGRALRGEEIVLYGDGSQRRDCLFVDDVVDALVMSAGSDDAAGEILNLGHDDSLTLDQIARTTQRAAGRPESVRCVPWPEELLRIDIGSFHGRLRQGQAGARVGARPLASTRASRRPCATISIARGPRRRPEASPPPLPSPGSQPPRRASWSRARCCWATSWRRWNPSWRSSSAAAAARSLASPAGPRHCSS